MSNKRVTKPKRYTFLAKGVLISMLAFSIGTGTVFASEDAANITSPTLTAELSKKVAVSENEEKTPSLLPGDFFYFIKTVYENIRLAITVDDVKEARLLAEFAQKRLAEANSLLAKGETEKSEQILQKSLENQQLAVEKVASEAEKPHEDKDREQVVEVKSDLQHNIIALTAALEKVKNPQAQAALLKNIEKSFGHLEKKLAKLENEAKEEQATPSASPAAVTTAVSADVQTDAVVSDVDILTASIEIEEKQKTVLHEKKKPEKEEKTKKEEKETRLIKQKKDHENNGKADEKNHGGK